MSSNINLHSSFSYNLPTMNLEELKRADELYDQFLQAVLDGKIPAAKLEALPIHSEKEEKLNVDNIIRDDCEKIGKLLETNKSTSVSIKKIAAFAIPLLIALAFIL